MLANKLGVSAEYMLKVYCKQTYLESITQLFVIPIFLFVGFLWYKLAKMWHEKIINHKWEEEGIFFIYAISIIFAAIFIVVISLVSIDSIKGLYNPEYYAISKLLHQIR